MSGRNGAKMAPRLIEMVKPRQNQNLVLNFRHRRMEDIAMKQKLLSLPRALARNIANVGGDRSYVMLGSLARLEKALIRWAMNELTIKHDFIPVVVPNVIHDHIIERCGFPTKSERSQVYKISGSIEKSILDESAIPVGDYRGISSACMAGTSEFALASIHIGDSIPVEELPKKYCALSRCYRAEATKTAAEWGVYRVHYFNKVEMLAYTLPNKSEAMHEEMLEIQKILFDQLKLEYRVLDMPEDDLGLPAKRKYDIEAWMPGRQKFGEISSTSNCADYQSSRLNIKYSQMVERDNQLQIHDGFVHTINGTACSSMRTLIAIFEQYQTDDERVKIPDVLLPYMNNDTIIPTDSETETLKQLDLYPQSFKSTSASSNRD